MIVINLFAGPGSGKSTTAADLFQHMKRQGVRAELVGEAAKDIIYRGALSQLKNQFLIAAEQYARLKNLESNGCAVAISDGPLLQNLVYAKDHGVHYYAELKALVEKCNNEFINLNIFIGRGKRVYQKFGRTQTEVEAQQLDNVIYEAFKDRFHTTFDVSDAASIKFYIEKKFLTMWGIRASTEKS